MSSCGIVNLLDTEITVVDETLVVLGHAAAHAVVAHRDRIRPLRPENRAVLTVINYVPDTSRGLYDGLISIGIVNRREVINGRVLIQLVRRIGDIHSSLGRGLTVADVIEVVAIAVVRVNRGGRVSEFAAGVVEIRVRIGRIEGIAKHVASDAAADDIRKALDRVGDNNTRARFPATNPRFPTS